LQQIQKNDLAPNLKRSKLKLKPKPKPKRKPKRKRSADSRRGRRKTQPHLIHPAHRILERNNDDTADGETLRVGEKSFPVGENTMTTVSQAVAGESNVADC
jgi:hypothetical protein